MCLPCLLPDLLRPGPADQPQDPGEPTEEEAEEMLRPFIIEFTKNFKIETNINRDDSILTGKTDFNVSV